MNDPKVYSLVHQRDGEQYSMLVICEDEAEAIFHADSLGLAMPSLVEAVIPNLSRELN